MFGDRFPPYVLTVVSQFIDILTEKKTVFFRFPWIEFRFKSFLELHVHFKGFMCIHMRKLHAECQLMHTFDAIRNIERQNNYRNILDDRLEL